MNKEILILGKGYIGKRLQAVLDCRISGQRILSLTDALTVVKKSKPKVLINCIGFTGARNVDDCELEKDKTIVSNTFVPMLLAEACLRNDIKFVHISSGCIFHFGYKTTQPIDEDIVPDYFDLYYSRTKIYSEVVLKVLARKYNILILRIRIPLDDRPHPKNIIDKLIKYKTIIDVPNSITYIPDFLQAVRHLLKIDAHGIYNIGLKKAIRYPELLEIYRRYVPDFQYQIIPVERLGLARTNLIMSMRKLEKSGFPIRSNKEILEECVKKYLGF